MTRQVLIRITTNQYWFLNGKTQALITPITDFTLLSTSTEDRLEIYVYNVYLKLLVYLHTFHMSNYVKRST